MDGNEDIYIQARNVGGWKMMAAMTSIDRNGSAAAEEGRRGRGKKRRREEEEEDGGGGPDYGCELMPAPKRSAGKSPGEM